MAKGRENKPHIGIYGRRNTGKSSLINALADQEIAIVSDVAGTTTDPVRKSMEIPGVGPVILVDTAGIDDVGDLGGKRISKTMDTLKTVDLAILLIAGNVLGEFEEALITAFREHEIPFLLIHNKADLEAASPATRAQASEDYAVSLFDFSCHVPSGKEAIIQEIRKQTPFTAYRQRSLLGGVVSHGDLVLLITPIDSEAPEGRLILPQVQAIRDILDNDAVCVVAKEREVDHLIKHLRPRPRLAITDSQVFLKADAMIPADIPLTSFSIMLAHHKGPFELYVKGTPKISALTDGDAILLLESCTHHVACDDIGRVKIPRWLGSFTGKRLVYDVVAGFNQLPRPIGDYALVIQCGGCVITPKQVQGRLGPALKAGIPVTNYGMAIAWMHGTFKRAVAPFLQGDITGGDYL